MPAADPLAPATAGQTWVIIPAYREAAMIGPVVAGLAAVCPHVVVVDDGSPDDTAARALGAGAVVLRHAVNRGQGAALATGMAYALAAGARYLVTFDADGQHRAEDLARLLAPLAAGEADYALGSRFLGRAAGMPAARRWLLRSAVLFTRLASGAALTDAHNGLRAFTRRGAERLRLTQDRMAHASELVDQIVASGLPFVEVPVEVRYTAYSRGKGQGSLAALRILLDYWLGRWLD